jgi:hypothetical protein
MVDPRCSTPAELESLAVRCVELHAYAPGGGLGDPKHYDAGSVVTVDVMLNDDFTGGGFETPEAPHGVMKRHPFRRGDALIFPSGKYHRIQKVVTGHRVVMILEFWKGVERNCDHRCGEQHGNCDFSQKNMVRFNPPIDEGYYE